MRQRIVVFVALELLVKASWELPGFSTLNEMTSRIRGEVNTSPSSPTARPLLGATCDLVRSSVGRGTAPRPLAGADLARLSDAAQAAGDADNRS